jgi:hypothetical protein
MIKGANNRLALLKRKVYDEEIDTGTAEESK